MDALNLENNQKRIQIKRDDVIVGELVFNPLDVIFAEKFYFLLKEFQTQFTEYKKKSRTLDADKRTDENGEPLNAEQRKKLVQEACIFARGKIDTLFGIGTSQTVFGDAYSLSVIQQFFESLTPLIQPARAKKIQQYTNKKRKR